MRHQISIADLDDFTVERKLAGSYGKGAHKSLICVVDIKDNSIIYKVLLRGELFSMSTGIDNAIEIYNNL